MTSSPNDEAPRTVSVAEAARLLGLSRPTIYALIQRGELPADQSSGTWRLPLAELKAWLNNLPSKKEEPQP